MIVNKENVRKWVNFLESGEFKQGTQCLKFEEELCVMGVGCEVSNLGRWILGSYSRYEHDPKQCSAIFPEFVAEYYGIERNPHIMGKNISYWNDKEGLNFNQIAILLRISLLGENPFLYKEEPEWYNNLFI